MSVRTKRLAALAVSLLVALLACEIGLRIAGLPFTGVELPPETASGRFDPDTGWSYKPSFTTQFTYGPRTVTEHYNRYGLRDRAADHEPDLRAPSVLFAGCSITMGQGVTYEESFPGRLDGALGLQSINLGVQGFGTDQALMLLKRFIEKFNTKVVVYTFITEHVMRNSVADRRLSAPFLRFPGTKPLFALDDEGHLYLSERAHPIEDDPLTPRLWSFLRVAKAKLDMHNFDQQRYERLTRELVREMFRTTRAHGAVFMVVDWGLGELSPPIGHGEPYRTILLQREAGPDWNSDKLKIAGDHHPNAEGHLRAAEVIERVMRQELEIAKKHAAAGD